MHREVNVLGGDLSDEVRIGVVFFHNPALATEGAGFPGTPRDSKVCTVLIFSHLEKKTGWSHAKTKHKIYNLCGRKKIL